MFVGFESFERYEGLGFRALGLKPVGAHVDALSRRA